MKKFLILLITLFCVTTLFGCDSTTDKPSDDSSSTPNGEENSDSQELPNGLRYMAIENEETGDYYEGFVNEENQPHGFGMMFYSNGDMYEGYFENGIKQGMGTMTFGSACIYIGEWDNDFMDGNGYMKWPMGDYFHGEWKDGNPYYGTKYFLQPDAPFDGSIEQRYCIYTGTFDGAGLLSGWGIMRWPSGDYYIGQWENNMRSGWGTQYWPSEDPNIPQYSFVGQFSHEHDGWIYGTGTMYYRDGRVVEGTWNGTELVSE